MTKPIRVQTLRDMRECDLFSGGKSHVVLPAKSTGTVRDLGVVSAMVVFDVPVPAMGYQLRTATLSISDLEILPDAAE